MRSFVDVKLQSEIPQLATMMISAMELSTMNGGEMVEKYARGRVPVDTGSLRDTIDTEVDDGAAQNTYGPGQAFAAAGFGPTGTSFSVAVCAGNVDGGYHGRSGETDRAVDYAIDVEYGTGQHGAEPYMTPAAEASFGPLIAETLSQLRAAIERCTVP